MCLKAQGRGLGMKCENSCASLDQNAHLSPKYQTVADTAADLSGVWAPCLEALLPWPLVLGK